MKRHPLAVFALLALSIGLPLLPGCGRDKGSATPQAAHELAELRAEHEASTRMDDDETQALHEEISALLARFDRTADATLASSPHRITLLHLACAYKKAELARCLLLDGAAPNAHQLTEAPSADMEDETNGSPPVLVPADTPLTWAIVPLHPEVTAEQMLQIVNLLVENGADVNLPGADGATPLETAALLGAPACEDVFLRLLALGARGPQENSSPIPLSALVTNNGWYRALQQLLKQGAPMATPYHSALHAAAGNALQKGTLECARMLLEHGAEVDALNNEGATALILAAGELALPHASDDELEAITAMLALLLEHGADPLRCSNAMPEYPGSCAADFIAMCPEVKAKLAARGITVPQRAVNLNAESDLLLAEICRASLFNTPAEEIAPHEARLRALLLDAPHEMRHSPFFGDALAHTVRLLARVDAPQTATLLAHLPIWHNEKAWVEGDNRTWPLMLALMDTPSLVLPRHALLEFARLMERRGLSDNAASLVEIMERDAEAQADIESLCQDASLPIRAGALTARLLRAGLPAPRNGDVAAWMEEHGVAEEDATPALRRALLLTSLDDFWYGAMAADEVAGLLQAMREAGAPHAADFYTQIAPNLANPEKLDMLTEEGSATAIARYELECATANLLWAQRESLQKLMESEKKNENEQHN